MMIPGENSSLLSTRALLKSSSDELDRLLDLTAHMMDRSIESANTKGMARETAEIILGLTNKLLHSARCVQILCMAGYSNEAQAQMRMMIETLAHMLFLARPAVRVRKKPTNRSLTSSFRGKLYTAACDLSRIRVHIDIHELRGWKRRLSSKHKKKIEDDRKLIEQHVGTDWAKRIWETRNCAGMAITQYIKAMLPPKLRAGIVSHEYALTSRVVHANDVENYIGENEETGELELAVPGAGRGERVLRTTGTLLLMGNSLLNNRFQLNEPRVEEERLRIQAYVDERRKAKK
jgi:hypothetical protein